MDKFIKYAIVSIVIGLLGMVVCPSAQSAAMTEFPTKGESGAKLNLVLFSEFH